MKKYNLLIVDDDKEIVRSIELFLKEEYNIIKAHNGLEALDIVMSKDIHIMVLDIMMPKLDGIKTLIKIREKKNIPVILLSAKSEDNDKILGLTIGADDYVTKPFSLSELTARIKSQLRRYTMLGSMEKSESKIIIKGLCIDTEARTVSVDGIDIHLTPLEYKILYFLCKNAGRVFSADEIYTAVWNEENPVTDNTIAVHIRHIREKTEINPKEPRYIKVVWGLGYKVEKG